MNELSFQVRELDRKLESLDKSVERERYEMPIEKVVKQKNGVESVMKNFFKRSMSGIGQGATAVGSETGSGIDLRQIRPVKYAEIESICKELVILLINQNISLDDATKVFMNKVSPQGTLSSRDISDVFQG